MAAALKILRQLEKLGAGEIFASSASDDMSTLPSCGGASSISSPGSDSSGDESAAPPKRRTVSFSAVFEEIDAVEGAVPVLRDVAEGAKSDAELKKVFCVHCGTRVAPQILKLRQCKFCTSCGKEHPPGLMVFANAGRESPNPSQEHVQWREIVDKLPSFPSVTYGAEAAQQKLVPVPNNGSSSYCSNDQVDWYQNNGRSRAAEVRARSKQRQQQQQWQQRPWQVGGYDPSAASRFGYPAGAGEQCSPTMGWSTQSSQWQHSNSSQSAGGPWHFSGRQ